MKKLSIVEKAKAYDEIIKKANKMHNENCEACQICIEELIPELREESEDERIMKEIIEYIKTGTYHKSWIAWLEKQGNLMKALQISNAKIGELIEKNYYLKEQLEKQGKNNMGISEATKQKLEDNLNKALQKETPESWNKFLDEQSCKEENLKERNICDTCEDSNGCLIPCCAKLLEKQGDQKPIIEMKSAEESLDIDSETYSKIVDECIYGEQKSADKIESRQEELTEFEKAVKQVMEEAIECGDTHNLKADADMLLRLVQKSSWSEEDENILNAIIYTVKNSGYKHCMGVSNEIMINWLKSLKERYSWKPSDEQMLAINTAINVLGKGTINGKYLVELLDQIKGL